MGLSAYTQHVTIKLNWTKNIIETYKEKSVTLLHFAGANYGGEYGKMPYYSVSKDLAQGNMGDQYEVSLKSIRTKKLSNSDEALLKNQNIDSDFKINAKVRTSRGKAKLVIDITPFRKSNGGIEKLLSAELQYRLKKASTKRHTTKRYSQNSILANGTWYKLKISESGIHYISYEQLKEMGIANPKQVRVFGNDQGLLSYKNDGTAIDDLAENKILYTPNGILFYAQNANKVYYNSNQKALYRKEHYYSDYMHYFFTSDVNTNFNNKLSQQNSLSDSPDLEITDFLDFAKIDINEYNIAKTGREFYGDIFDVELTRNYSFDFPNLVKTKKAKVNISVAAAAGSPSTFNVKSGAYSGTIHVPAVTQITEKAKPGSKFFEVLPTQSNKIDISLTYNQILPSWQGWLNYIEVTANRKLKWTGKAMHFSNQSFVSQGNTARYTISNAQDNLEIWDISDPIKPIKQVFKKSGDKIQFTVSNTQVKKFIIFNSDNYITPNIAEAEQIGNQNLHATPYNIDMLIVTHELFLSHANQIKAMRQAEGLKVMITTPEKIYNEFSCGTPDVSAIRNFVKMIYEKAPNPQNAIRYLLLIGDASFDNKGTFPENTNLLLSYQVGNSLGEEYSYFSDDFFGLLDDGEGEMHDALEGLLDIGVGRIPANSISQADTYIAKLKSYQNYNTYKSWRNNLVFIADDEDQNDHIADADTLTKFIEQKYPWFNITKIYLDSYRQEIIAGGERYPQAQADINANVLKGSLLINYTGHGGKKGWARERVLTVKDIQSWTNFDKLSLFVTATCEFTGFDDYELQTAGEHVFFNPKGGAIAMFTTARVAYIASNANLTKALYRFIFEKDAQGNQYRMGDVIRLTKNYRGGNHNDLIFFYLGDPTLKLGYAAENNVITETINGKNINTFNDTIKALSKITITGRVENSNKELMTNFNGNLYSTIFDKAQTITTLNNNGVGIWKYKDRKNILFKGQSSVKAGRFNIEFIVPKDIYLNVDTGKITYYATDKNISAKGYNKSFLVGDISSDYPPDNQGPKISLYMNDENFVEGGSTDADPTLFAKLWDESGINTASGAVGHDITAIIDNDPKQTYYLNNDYIADPNTYKSGSIKYYLFDLPEGEHNLKLSTRDVYNNKSEKTLSFTVINAKDLSIKHLLNYPNPFTTSTDFYFEHNKAHDQLDILIQIFSPSGRLVKTIQEKITPQGYRAGPFHWDGTDDFGNRIGRGAYVYILKVRDSNGNTKKKYQKLLILK